jgi:hypothetical protein
LPEYFSRRWFRQFDLVAGLDGSSCDTDLKFRALDLARLTPFDCAGSCEKKSADFFAELILVMKKLLPNSPLKNSLI